MLESIFGPTLRDTPNRYRGPLPPELRGKPRQHSSKYRRHQGSRECARRVRQMTKYVVSNRFAIFNPDWQAVVEDGAAGGVA